MKNLKLIFLFILFQTSFTFAQNYSFISKNLHKMTDEEMMNNQTQLTADIPLYDVEGNTIEPSQINDIMNSGNFFPVVYGDKNHVPKAIIFRKSTKEEKESFMQAMRNRDPNANFTPGQKAADFIAYDIDGKKIDLKSLKGKVVVLNFWFTSCPPCVAEMPELNKLVDKYKDVTFIGITFDKKEKVKKFLKSHDFKYQLVSDNEGVINDYKVIGFPTHFLIDKDGKIVMRKVGNYVKELDEKLSLLTK